MLIDTKVIRDKHIRFHVIGIEGPSPVQRVSKLNLKLVFIMNTDRIFYRTIQLSNSPVLCHKQFGIEDTGL